MVESAEINHLVRELARLSHDGIVHRELALKYRREMFWHPSGRRQRRYEKWRTSWLTIRSQRRFLEQKIAVARGES